MFFATLGAALMQHGAQVTRLTFCPGDHIFWRRSSGNRVAFRKKREHYPSFLAQLITRLEITDIVCLGDGRFWHSRAIQVCEKLPDPPKIHIIEHGYFRPGWLTLERDGINANSSFPRQPSLIDQIAAQANTPISQTFDSSFLHYATLDICWNLANVLLAPIWFPHFKTHALDHPIKEWFGWIKKAFYSSLTRKKTGANMAEIEKHKGPVFLFPLQLATDYQIRQHGPPNGLLGAVQDTITSFAKFAKADTMLVFKIHPLDNGHQNWQAEIAALTRECRQPVVFLQGGDLESLLKNSAGCITVNSTVGLRAVELGIATHVLGQAIYNVKGLVDSRPLQGFWNNPQKPDADLAKNFKQALIAATQIPGAFEGSGVNTGAQNAADKILNSSRSSFE